MEKKAVQMVRRISKAGSITLPVEVRRELELHAKTAVEISVVDGGLFIGKHQENCVFCGSYEQLKTVKSKMICSSCLSEMK